MYVYRIAKDEQTNDIAKGQTYGKPEQVLVLIDF